MLGEPAAPFAHRVGGCLDAQADVLVLRAFRGQKDDAGPLRQPLRSLSPRRQTLKLTPLPLRQIDRNRRLAHRQSSAESIRKENCTYLPITTLAPFALGSGRAGGIAHVLALVALDRGCVYGRHYRRRVCRRNQGARYSESPTVAPM
jgi:hypothetical protein